MKSNSKNLSYIINSFLAFIVMQSTGVLFSQTSYAQVLEEIVVTAQKREENL